MGEMEHFEDDDIGRLLVGHGAVEMEVRFRDRLRDNTRHAVTGHARMRTRRRTFVFAAIAAATVVAAVVWRPSGGAGSHARRALLLGGAPPVLTVTAVQSHAVGRFGLALQVGDRLPAGTVVRTGKHGRLTLLTREGSEFTLNEKSEFALSPDGVSGALRRGEVYCRSRLHEIRRIATPAGEIHLLGTALDAALTQPDTVAVTVVEGKVRLANSHGEAIVEAGRKAVLTTAQAPAGGVPVDPAAEISWYDGRGRIVSDFGDIVYRLQRKRGEDLVTEIWTMHADGAGKRLVKAYLAYVFLGPWVPESQWVFLQTHGVRLNVPDYQRRSAHAANGSPIGGLGEQGWLLNTLTGQEIPIVLPSGYRSTWMTLSPDGTQAVVVGRYSPTSVPGTATKQGPWIYNLQTRTIRELSGLGLHVSFAWSPDGRTLATTHYHSGDWAKSHLRLVEVETGRITDLDEAYGGTPSFSPDGKKLVYCGDFVEGHEGRYQDSVRVLDLTTNESRPITPVGLKLSKPTWSPDGTQVAYFENHEIIVNPDEGPVIPKYVLCVAAADGSGTKQLYEADEFLDALAWSQDGRWIHVSTSAGVHRIAPDGSGVTDLGGTERDSVLTPPQRADMDGALAALTEAVFQYAVGCDKEEQARVAEAKQAYATAAKEFAAVLWQYPQAQLSANHVLMHSDAAQQKADRPEAEIIAGVCRERLNIAGRMAEREAARHGEWPRELATLKGWVRGRWNTPEWVDRVFAACPSGGDWIYTPPNASPVAGEVLLRCTAHPEHRWIWQQRDVEAYLARLKHPFRY